MALQYKPTRMELSNLKKRRTVAIRGHKMMKDKRDELVRRFIILARKNKALRQEMEKKLGEAMQNFVLARAMMSGNEIEEALMYPARAIKVDMQKQNILSIPVPKLSLDTQDGFVYPYGFATTGADLDGAVQALAEILPLMLELAEVEKATSRLADEIEKTRRRVNALEYVMIPELEGNIKYISMKLEENENATKVRLLKVKEMVLQDAHHYQQ